MSAPSRTTPLAVDALATFGFEPCREEKCSITSLHAKHELLKGRRAYTLKGCPSCGSKLTRPHRKKSYCAKCGWRKPEGKVSKNTPEAIQEQMNA